MWKVCKKSKIAQIYYFEPQSAGINVQLGQSTQSESTPRRLTLDNSIACILSKNCLIWRWKPYFKKIISAYFVGTNFNRPNMFRKARRGYRENLLVFKVITHTSLPSCLVSFSSKICIKYRKHLVSYFNWFFGNTEISAV